MTMEIFTWIGVAATVIFGTAGAVVGAALLINSAIHALGFHRRFVLWVVAEIKGAKPITPDEMCDHPDCGERAGRRTSVTHGNGYAMVRHCVRHEDWAIETAASRAPSADSR